MATMLYTKNGVPIRQSGSDLFDCRGRQVARMHGNKAYGPDGRYLATLTGNRLVHRSADSVSRPFSFTPRHVVGFSVVSVVGVAISGDEPNFG
jgi:hypothetical protein